MILWFVTSIFKEYDRPWFHVHLVLDFFKKVGIYVKLEKCGFHQFEVEFLDYIIFGDGIRMDFHKVQTIVDWATPTFVWDVQSFL
jgi:hypothetical protein